MKTTQLQNLNVSFQGSCEGGWIEVSEFFLNQGNHQIILSKDEKDENCFMKACKRGQSKVVALLLKHPNIAEIINDKEKTGSTGYMKACLMPSIKVMTLIHEHTTDPIEREDVYNVFKSLCKNYSTEAKKSGNENEETKKWRNVLEFILTKNDFRKMGTSTLGPKVTNHPSKENVSVISQTIDEEDLYTMTFTKTLIIHMDTSNEVPTFKFNP